MKQFLYTITDEVGLHARPASLLVNEAKKYKSKITIEVNGKTAEATRLMMVMGLGAKQNNEVTVTIEGEDEDFAYQKIESFFKDNL